MPTTIGLALPAGPPAADHPRVTLSSVAGMVTLDVTRSDTEYDGLAATWEEVPLPGRAPALVPGGYNLKRMVVRGLIGRHPAGDGLGEPERIRNRLGTLIRMAEHPEQRPVACSIGALIASAFVITNLRVRALRRRHGDNAIIRAEVEVELTEAVFLDVPGPGSSPANAVTKPGPGALPSGTLTSIPGAGTGVLGGGDIARTNGIPTKAGPRSGRRHTTAAGETLYRVAFLYYGNGELWPLLAEANGIRDPRTVTAGTVLVIP